MRTFYFSFLLMILLGACAGEPLTPPPLERKVQHVQPSRIRQDVLLMTELKRPGETAFENLTAVIGDTLYTSTFKGKIYSGDTMWPKRTLLVDLKSEYMLDKLFVQPIEQDFIVVWQETTHEGTRSSLARYRSGSAYPAWVKTYRLPDPGQPVIDGSNCYFSLRGMVGNLDIRNGNENWRVDSLFNDKIHFASFFPAHVYSDSVVFKERVAVASNRVPDSVVFNLKSGKRIR